VIEEVLALDRKIELVRAVLADLLQCVKAALAESVSD